MADHRKTGLVIGGSRGIGAAIVKRFDQARWRIALTYHHHARRAERLAESCIIQPAVFQLDICESEQVIVFAKSLQKRFQRLDSLVLSASGGLERDKPPGFAELINVDAQVRLCETLVPLIRPGGRTVFMTSHEAHFCDRITPYPPYAPIAHSKKRGEDALRGLSSLFEHNNVTLHIVSAELVDGTATAKILEIKDPEHIAARRAELGGLPSPEDVADHVFSAIQDKTCAGIQTSYIPEPDSRYLPCQ